MPQSLTKNYIHIVFSTKNRQKFIDDALAPELYAYLGGICKNLECNPVKIGGHKDHVHILCLLSKKVALVHLLEKVKSHSSKWAKTRGDKYRNFYWQAGYGVFSVSYTAVDVVTQYIENQATHHSKKSFKDEYLAFLIENHIDFDERYVWD